MDNSEFEVTRRTLYDDPDTTTQTSSAAARGNVRVPRKNGVLDPRMGVSTKKGTCTTCGEKVNLCPGHYAHIELVRPIFHWGYFKNVQATLSCVCKFCSGILLTQVQMVSMDSF